MRRSTRHYKTRRPVGAEKLVNAQFSQVCHSISDHFKKQAQFQIKLTFSENVMISRGTKKSSTMTFR